MNFTMTLKKEDYKYFNYFYILRGGLKKTMIGIASTTILCIGFDLMILSIRGDNSFGFSKFLGIFVMIMSIYYLFVFIAIRNKLNKMINASPDLIGKKAVCIDEYGISVDGEIVKESIKWEGLIDFIETKSHFLLFNTIVSAIILPKEFIEKAGLLDEIHLLLKSKSDQLKIKYTTFY